MQRIWWTLIGIIVVFLIAGWVDLPGTHNAFGQNVTVKKGLDLAGGARILECAKNGTTPSNADMNTARDVINSRIAGGFGLTEPQVARVGTNCISAEIPGISNKDQARVFNIIGKTGYLALTDSGTQSLTAGTPVKLVCQANGPECPPGMKVGVTNLSATPKPIMAVVVQGSYVTPGSAQAGYDNANAPQVTYTLHGKGADDWCNFTSNHVKQFSAIVLDNKIVSDPQIQGVICGGQTQITGITSIGDAKNISTFLNYGALPIALHVDSSQQVAASLGPEYVREATLAGAIGLVIVALFMLLYYRLPGLIADLALVIYAVVVFSLFKLLGVTLTLAGIAGFILSIGMAVDANVLIFERMKEELRSGRTLGGAVEAGFSRAFPSIRDSNASTLITTVILFWFGHNFAATVITGFATTLFIGVAISFVTAYIVSRTFLRLLVHSGTARTPRMYGVESMAGAPVV